jgi:membrane fusion protein (multidrug efflux system)
MPLNSGSRPLRRILFIVVIAALLLAGLGYGFWFVTTGRYLESTENAYVEADIAVIAPRVAGYIRSVNVDDNQAVTPGATLVTIEDTDYRARVNRAEAMVSRSQAGQGTAAATERAQESAISQAQAALEAARADSVQAQADLKRYTALLAQGFVTKQRIDQLRATAAARRADVERAAAAVAAARSQRSGAASAQGSAAADRAGAVADLASAKFDLDNTRLVAPIDGVVGNRTARVGQYVRAGQQLMVVVPVERSYVVANFKETQVARMKPGQPVELKADTYKKVKLTGTIASLSPAAGSRFSLLPPENATGNFTKIVQRIPVKVLVDRPLPAGVRLVPGMSVEATVDIRSEPRGDRRR